MFRSLVRLIVARAIFQWIWRFIKLFFVMLTVSVTSIWLGFPKAIDRIVMVWSDEAAAMGIPLNYQPALKIATQVVATITLVLGWVLLASLTAFIIRRFL